jgi:hypothetical protein
MNCPKCGEKARVVDSRTREGCVWRRRKCASGHLTHTQEQFIEKKPREKKPLPLPKRQPKVRPPAVPYPPAKKEWNLEVTRDSPLWLKSIAMRLER